MEDHIEKIIGRCMAHHEIMFAASIAKINDPEVVSACIAEWNRMANQETLGINLWNKIELRRAGLGRIN